MEVVEVEREDWSVPADYTEETRIPAIAAEPASPSWRASREDRYWNDDV